jgi:hypothetical protein
MSWFAVEKYIPQQLADDHPGWQRGFSSPQKPSSLSSYKTTVVQVKYHEPDGGASVSGKISTSAYEVNINAYSLMDKSWI